MTHLQPPETVEGSKGAEESNHNKEAKVSPTHAFLFTHGKGNASKFQANVAEFIFIL